MSTQEIVYHQQKIDQIVRKLVDLDLELENVRETLQEPYPNPGDPVADQTRKNCERLVEFLWAFRRNLLNQKIISEHMVEILEVDYHLESEIAGLQLERQILRDHRC
ncbi:hypothetical protein CRE_18653 [Caenorhabditis remanei]|uniref:Uncharacterized protein n=1 Tax=Caenorhabditis remanei TaxID=31234 RepID=E3LKL6_CAERE|nr:hypothetical protein CRE_18653 [Caenorhabditis remanei]